MPWLQQCDISQRVWSGIDRAIQLDAIFTRMIWQRRSNMARILIIINHYSRQLVTKALIKLLGRNQPRTHMPNSESQVRLLCRNLVMVQSKSDMNSSSLELLRMLLSLVQNLDGLGSVIFSRMNGARSGCLRLGKLRYWAMKFVAVFLDMCCYADCFWDVFDVFKLQIIKYSYKLEDTLNKKLQQRSHVLRNSWGCEKMYLIVDECTDYQFSFGIIRSSKILQNTFEKWKIGNKRMNKFQPFALQKYTIGQLLTQIHANQNTKKSRNIRLTDITSNRPNQDHHNLYPCLQDEHTSGRYHLRQQLQYIDENVIDRQNCLSVSSPFYSKQKYKNNCRRSEHLCKMEKSRNVLNGFLRKGKINQYQDRKQMDSYQKRSLYENYHKNYHPRLSTHQLSTPPVHSHEKQQKKKKCLPSCGLFRIKCNNCKQKLDSFNTQFENYLKKRGVWHRIKIGAKQQESQDKIKSFITSKLIQAYMKILEQSNGELTSQSNEQLKKFKQKIAAGSSDILEKLNQYINTLGISKKEKIMLYKWSENLGNILGREILKNYYRRGRVRNSEILRGSRSYNQETNKLIDFKMFKEISGNYLNRMPNQIGLKFKQRVEEKNKSKSGSQPKESSKEKMDNQNILNQQQSRIRNKQSQYSRNTQQCPQQCNPTNKSIPFSTTQFQKQPYSKKMKKKFTNFSQATSQLSSNQEHEGDRNNKESLNKIMSLKYLKNKNNQNQTPALSGLRDGAQSKLTNNIIIKKKQQKKINININNIQRDHYKDKQRDKQSIGALSKKIMTNKLITQKNITQQAITQKNITIKQIQLQIEAKAKQETTFINFSEQFEQLCGQCRIKQEEPKKIRRRRYGIIHKNLQLDNSQQEQFNKFKKQVIRSKKMQNQIQKVLKKIDCESSIISNREARLNINRKIHLMENIIDMNYDGKIKNTLEFYVNIFKKNYKINRYRLRHRREDLLQEELEAEIKQNDSHGLNKQANQTISQFIESNLKKLLENQKLLFYGLESTKYDLNERDQEEDDLMKKNKNPQRYKDGKGDGDCLRKEFILQKIEMKEKKGRHERFSFMPASMGEKLKQNRNSQLSQMGY